MEKKDIYKIIKPGCIEDELDSRDDAHAYETVMGARPPEMPTFQVGYDVEETLKYELEDDSQYPTLGCVAHGGTDDVEVTYHVHTGKRFHLSRRDPYSQIHSPGGGASVRSFFKLANKKGICEDEHLPTYMPDGTLTETWLRQRSGISPDAEKNALQNRIGPYRAIQSLDVEVIAQAQLENNGCTGAYKVYGYNMGHCIFFKGYGIHGGYHGIKYKDSYPPYDKWLVTKNGNWYLDYPASSKQIKLYSFWTCEANPEWKKEIINMPTQLVKKKTKKQVYILVNGKRKWITDEEELRDLYDGGIIGVGKSWNELWEDINKNAVDTLPGIFEGSIYGKPNFSTRLKIWLGYGK